MWNSLICNAIETKHLLRFTYENHTRIVEPFCHGFSTTSRDVLRAYWVGSYSESEHEPPWRLYTVSEMSDIEMLKDTFSGDRPGYEPNDSHMTTIYCRI